MVAYQYRRLRGLFDLGRLQFWKEEEIFDLPGQPDSFPWLEFKQASFFLQWEIRANTVIVANITKTRVRIQRDAVFRFVYRINEYIPRNLLSRVSFFKVFTLEFRLAFLLPCLMHLFKRPKWIKRHWR